MKRILTLALAIVMAISTASAWGRIGHATVAKIAENHLTKKAKRQITEYLHGESIVKWATYADDSKPELLVDLGFEPTNAKRFVTYPHTFVTNADGTPYRDVRKGDEYVKNCIYYVEKMAAELKANAKDMTDSVRVAHIALIVHFVGDMHCPEHIRCPEDPTAGDFYIYLDKDRVRYHSLWDSKIIAAHNPWGFSDTAKLFDTYTKRQIAQITAGTPYDWGYDSVVATRKVHQVKEGAKFDKRLYFNEYAPIAQAQICKAGYRLAALLNDIFE
ncbi:MAG: S1/P1 nuclease [Alistipes sp.]|nr:S1/P1 nuclease [Alistipes sp.]